MTYEMAMKILDRVRDGANYPIHIIKEALKATGDLEESIY
jgi:hypothetical protein